MPTKTKTAPPRKSGLAGIHKGRTDLFRIPRNRCVIDEGFNPRIDFGEIDALAGQIKGRGIVRPVNGHMGDDGKFHITDGERRLRGLDLAIERKWVKGDAALVPVLPDPRNQTEADRVLSTLILNSGKPLNMLEQGNSFIRALKEGLSPDDISASTGDSKTHIRNCCSLVTDACDELRRLVEKNLISPTTAVEIIREVPDKEKQDDVVRQAFVKCLDAGAERITAKHLPIAIGKEAQARRRNGAEDRGQTTEDRGQSGENTEREPFEHDWEKTDLVSGANTNYRCTRCGAKGVRYGLSWPPATKSKGCIAPPEESSQTSALGPRSSALGSAEPPLFADATPDGPETDGEGRFISGFIDRPVKFTAHGVSGKDQLVTMHEEWFYGFILKWPGKAKGDGFLKVDANRKTGRAFLTNKDAEIAAIQAMRSELELSDFKYKALSIEDLDDHLEELTKDLPPAAAEPSPGAPASTIANPVMRPLPVVQTLADRVELLRGLLSDIAPADSEKDRRKTLVVILKFLDQKSDRKLVARHITGVDR